MDPTRLRVLLVHQNFPGQFRPLLKALPPERFDLTALTDAANKQPHGLPALTYATPGAVAPDAPADLSAPFAQQTMRAALAAKAMQGAHAAGYRPDVILAHPGWGEAMLARAVFPQAKIAMLAEYYYRCAPEDLAFDREFQSGSQRNAFARRARNAGMLASMIDADLMVSPTRWQADTFPPALRTHIEILHEGIDTDAAAPNPAASLRFQRDDLTLKAGDEVVTFVNRNLEPFRGYHVFMRALPAILAARPRAHAVIVGGDGVSYGAGPPAGRTWKAHFLAEVQARLPMERVHFVGRLPYPRLIELFQISAAHVYLSYPFVLSWSMLEAMSAGALVVASRTGPIPEAIRDGHNGLLVDFHDGAGLAARVVDALSRPERYAAMRAAARRSVIETYDLKTRCGPLWAARLERLAGA